MVLEPYHTEVHEQMRKIIRAFVKKEIAPFVEHWEETISANKNLYRKMADANLLGLHYPVEIGGQGGDHYTGIVLAEELGRAGCGGLAQKIVIQSNLAVYPIFEFGTSEQHSEYLSPVLKGERVVAYGVTQLHQNSTTNSSYVVAKKVDNDYMLNGMKISIKNYTKADFVLVLATIANNNGDDNVCFLIVDTHLPGVSISNPLSKVGMRSLDVAHLTLENVKVSHKHVININEKFLNRIYMLELLYTAAIANGIAQYTYELTLDYAQTRKAFNKSISNFQIISHLLAEMKTEIDICRELTYAAIFEFNKENTSEKVIFMAKLAATQISHWVADRSLQIYGGHGYMEEYPIARIWRDTRLLRIDGGTDEYIKELIAEQFQLL